MIACRYPISFDVRALYASIPPEDAIEAMKGQLEPLLENHLQLRINQISDLFTIILLNSFFEFNGDIFPQKAGCLWETPYLMVCYRPEHLGLIS